MATHISNFTLRKQGNGDRELKEILECKHNYFNVNINIEIVHSQVQ